MSSIGRIGSPTAPVDVPEPESSDSKSTELRGETASDLMDGVDTFDDLASQAFFHRGDGIDNPLMSYEDTSSPDGTIVVFQTPEPEPIVPIPGPEIDPEVLGGGGGGGTGPPGPTPMPPPVVPSVGNTHHQKEIFMTE